TLRFATTQKRHNSTFNARWLSEQKLRLGRLFFHGTTTEETLEAGKILRTLTSDWRRFIAGAEGYLIDEKRRHVNNVTYTRWAESARINWAWNIARHVDPANSQKWSELWTPQGTGLILRSIKVDYKFPMEFPDKVTVYHKLADVKQDSFTLDVIILSEKHQRVAARCWEDIVVYNYKPSDAAQKPGKAPIPQFVQEVFDETLRQQKEVREDASEEIQEIQRQINNLEQRVLSRKEM
ncbi:thioesterase-like superfamily-domain-containing protein, partial [Sphaerosporella brunnea]